MPYHLAKERECQYRSLLAEPTTARYWILAMPSVSRRSNYSIVATSTAALPKVLIQAAGNSSLLVI